MFSYLANFNQKEETAAKTDHSAETDVQSERSKGDAARKDICPGKTEEDRNTSPLDFTFTNSSGMFGFYIVFQSNSRNILS